MNRIVVVLASLLCACVSSTSNLQPVTMKGGNMFTTCSGVVEDWASCNAKAIKACSGKYDVVQKDENPSGAQRELTFKCK